VYKLKTITYKLLKKGKTAFYITLLSSDFCVNGCVDDDDVDSKDGDIQLM
jgi:hypothetical protein